MTSVFWVKGTNTIWQERGGTSGRLNFLLLLITFMSLSPFLHLRKTGSRFACGHVEKTKEGLREGLKPPGGKMTLSQYTEISVASMTSSKR